MMRRSTYLLGAMLLVGIGAFGQLASAPAQDGLTKLRVSTIPVIDAAPLHAALAKGFFREQALDVDITPTVGGATGLPALAAGQIQVALSNIVSIVLGAQQGLGFEMIAPTSASNDQPPNSAGLVAKRGSNLKAGKDLEGKRVAVNTRNSINWLVVREWVRLTGGDPDKLTFLEVPFPNMGDALKGNQLDAAFMVDPFLSEGLSSGVTEVVGWPYDKIMKRVPIAQYAATKGFIQSNPDVIERWVRGYNKGIDWINQNKGSDDWYSLIAGYTHLTTAQLRNIALPVWDKTVDSSRVAKMIEIMRANGMLESNVDSKSLLNNLMYKTAVEVVR